MLSCPSSGLSSLLVGLVASRTSEQLSIPVELQGVAKKTKDCPYLTQIFHCHFQILLVVLEDLGLIVAGKVVCEGVCPLEGLTTLLQSFASCFQELHFDPRHVR